MEDCYSIRALVEFPADLMICNLMKAVAMIVASKTLSLDQWRPNAAYVELICKKSTLIKSCLDSPKTYPVKDQSLTANGRILQDDQTTTFYKY